MKILVVVDSINVDDSSGSKANVALIANLIQAKFEVKVYHYTQKKVHLPAAECVSILEKKWNGMYFLSRCQRFFSRWTGINLNPFLEGFFGFSFTFFNDTSSIVQALRKEKSFEPDLIITLSKGTSFRPHYALLKLPEWHSKWLAYVHDPYPYHFYPRPYNWLQPGCKQKELFFHKVSEKARYSSFPSQLLKEWMGSYFPNFLKNGVIIPHQNAKNMLECSKFLSYFDASKFNLLHAGNLFKQRSPEGLIRGFQLFLKHHPEAKNDARMLLLGPAVDHPQMLESYQKNCPEIYVYNGNIAFEEIYHLQQNVSINIILESKSEISPFLPGKFPHCVEANKPILALGPYYSEIKRLLGTDYPYWAEIDDTERIAGIIEKLYNLWKQNPENLLLNRSDLVYYLSANHLKDVINNL